MQAEKPNEAKMTLRDTIAPKSDQLNYDDLLTGPLTVRVTGLKAGTPEQPVIIEIADAATGAQLRPYKPCKSMRRVLIACWGDKGRDWIGQRATLYGDPDVHFGGVAVGGIRISHVTLIAAPVTVKLTTSRSKRSDYIVRPLKDAEGGAA
jgi:hypothetical protein